jgi:hypothetical protein
MALEEEDDTAPLGNRDTFGNDLEFPSHIQRHTGVELS